MKIEQRRWVIKEQEQKREQWKQFYHSLKNEKKTWKFIRKKNKLEQEQLFFVVF